MMAFVLDASIASVWALADETSLVADAALDRLRSDTCLVPPLWWYEIRNVLIVNERRKRITPDNSAVFLRIIGEYPIQVDAVLDEQTNLRFARDYGLSFYDAAYLAVAHRNGIPLATLDKNLKSAAESAGVLLLG